MYSDESAVTSVSVILLALVIISAMGCGSMNSDSNRVLESISVAPVTASAGTGAVQFTALGTFSKPPSPAAVTFVAPYSGGWASSDLRVATISPQGVATCVSAGTVTITAEASSNSVNSPAMSIAVSGRAQLTCP